MLSKVCIFVCDVDLLMECERNRIMHDTCTVNISFLVHFCVECTNVYHKAYCFCSVVKAEILEWNIQCLEGKIVTLKG